MYTLLIGGLVGIAFTWMTQRPSWLSFLSFLGLIIVLVNTGF